MTTSYTSSSSTVWMYWADSGTGSTTNSINTWITWTTAGTTSNHYEPRHISPEEIEAQRIKQERDRAEKEAAEKRAEELLMNALTIEQKKSLDEMKAFVIKSEMQRTYRIKRGGHNIEELNDAGIPVKRFCIVPKDSVPEADKLLAQKLMLEYNEAEFLRIANSVRL